MELSMRQIFFCKIGQIQVVWEMRIFYYCLKMNNDQEESVSSAVYKYDTSTDTAFFENFPDYREGYQCW